MSTLAAKSVHGKRRRHRAGGLKSPRWTPAASSGASSRLCGSPRLPRFHSTRHAGPRLHLCAPRGTLAAPHRCPDLSNRIRSPLRRPGHAWLPGASQSPSSPLRGGIATGRRRDAVFTSGSCPRAETALLLTYNIAGTTSKTSEARNVQHRRATGINMESCQEAPFAETCDGDSGDNAGARTPNKLPATPLTGKTWPYTYRTRGCDMGIRRAKSERQSHRSERQGA